MAAHTSAGKTVVAEYAFALASKVILYPQLVLLYHCDLIVASIYCTKSCSFFGFVHLNLEANSQLSSLLM